MVRLSLSVMSGIPEAMLLLKEVERSAPQPYPFHPRRPPGWARLGSMPKRRAVLLRIANVNPASVSSHSDRVLYGAVGVFILLYFVYATVGGAAVGGGPARHTPPRVQAA